MWSELRTVLAEDWRRYRRRYLIEAFVFTAVVVGAAHVRRIANRPTDPIFLLHIMLADFCEDESRLMKSRAETCREWAARGVAWEIQGAEAAALRICPYPWDTPASPSWSDQAAVWDRAAERSAKTAERYARRDD